HTVSEICAGCRASSAASAAGARRLRIRSSCRAKMAAPKSHSMKLIKVAACTLNQTPLDWGNNQRHLTEALGRARRAGVSVLCLPELCITGYGCEDAFLAPGTHATALEVLEELLEHTRGMI